MEAEMIVREKFDLVKFYCPPIINFNNFKTVCKVLEWHGANIQKIDWNTNLAELPENEKVVAVVLNDKPYEYIQQIVSNGHLPVSTDGKVLVRSSELKQGIMVGKKIKVFIYPPDKDLSLFTEFSSNVYSTLLWRGERVKKVKWLNGEVSELPKSEKVIIPLDSMYDGNLQNLYQAKLFQGHLFVYQGSIIFDDEVSYIRDRRRKLKLKSSWQKLIYKFRGT